MLEPGGTPDHIEQALDMVPPDHFAAAGKVIPPTQPAKDMPNASDAALIDLLRARRAKKPGQRQ